MTRTLVVLMVVALTSFLGTKVANTVNATITKQQAMVPQ
jgi:hypothetical protein